MNADDDLARRQRNATSDPEDARARAAAHASSRRRSNSKLARALIQTRSADRKQREDGLADAIAALVSLFNRNKIIIGHGGANTLIRNQSDSASAPFIYNSYLLRLELRRAETPHEDVCVIAYDDEARRWRATVGASHTAHAVADWCRDCDDQDITRHARKIARALEGLSAAYSESHEEIRQELARLEGTGLLSEPPPLS